jgi:hypothetical protein
MIGNGARSCQFNTINGPEAPRADPGPMVISFQSAFTTGRGITAII